MNIPLKPRTLGEEFALVARLAVIYGGPLIALFLLMSMPELFAELAGDDRGLWSIPLFFLWPLANGYATARVAGAFGGRRVGHGQALGAAVKVYGALLVWQLLVVLVTSVGLLLLVVPGLMWYSRISLAAPDLVMEQNGLGRALNRSSALIRGAWFRVTLLISVWVLVAIGFQLVLLAVEPVSGSGDQLLWLGMHYAVESLVSVLLTIAPVVAYYSRRCAVENLDLRDLAGMVDAIGSRPATRRR